MMETLMSKIHITHPKPTQKPKKALIWIDLEMTGLDTQRDEIIEIATIVTDDDLNILAEGPVFAIKVPDTALNAMDEWCTRQHRESGLTDRVRRSKITLAYAEQATIEFLSKWADEGISPMCGNSICQDRRFFGKTNAQIGSVFSLS